MSYPETVRFQHHAQGIDWEELVHLFKSANLGGREGDKIRRAFNKSTVVCFALDGSRLVGAARALSDGEYHATIYDVVVHPDFQRQGLGTRLMSEVLATLPVWRILLVAEGDARRFYQRLGFEPYGDVMARLDRTKLYGSP
jgi:aralkylamine N-acetyltransferase